MEKISDATLAELIDCLGPNHENTLSALKELQSYRAARGMSDDEDFEKLYNELASTVETSEYELDASDLFNFMKAGFRAALSIEDTSKDV